MVDRLYPVVNLNAYQPAHGQSCSWLSIPTASPSACRRSHRQHVALDIESAASHPPSTFERCLFISFISYLRRLFFPLHRISPSSLLLWHSLFSSSPTLLSLCKKKQKFKQRASKIPISMNPPTDTAKFITPESKRLHKDVYSEIKVVPGYTV